MLGTIAIRRPRRLVRQRLAEGTLNGGGRMRFRVVTVGAMSLLASCSQQQSNSVTLYRNSPFAVGMPIDGPTIHPSRRGRVESLRVVESWALAEIEQQMTNARRRDMATPV